MTGSRTSAAHITDYEIVKCNFVEYLPLLSKLILIGEVSAGKT